MKKNKRYYQITRRLTKKEREEKGKEYELHVGKYYENLGYSVEYRGINLGRNDGGIDLIAKRGTKTLLIQCKNLDTDGSIYQKHIRQFYGDCILYLEKYNLPNNNNVTFIYAIPKKELLYKHAEDFFKKQYANCRYWIIPFQNNIHPKKNYVKKERKTKPNIKKYYLLGIFILFILFILTNLPQKNTSHVLNIKPKLITKNPVDKTAVKKIKKSKPKISYFDLQIENQKLKDKLKKHHINYQPLLKQIDRNKKYKYQIDKEQAKNKELKRLIKINKLK